MNKVLIMTDSTADLSPELLIKYDIQAIPLYIRFDEDVYLDGVDITTRELFERVESRGIMAKSSGLRSADFNIAFRRYMARGYDIVYIGVSSELSGSVQSAEIARNSIDPQRIYVVDSLNLSAGLGLLVLKAKDLRDQGLSAKKIKQEIEKLVPMVRSYYIITSLDYLYRGGRMNAFQMTFGKVIANKPMITVRNGQIEVVKRPSGAMDKMTKKLFDFYRSSENQIDLDYAIVSENSNSVAFERLVAQFKTQAKVREVITTQIGCVLSVHTGKNTVGIAYLVNGLL